MAKFPFPFRSGFGSDNERRDLALATNFDKAATEDFVTAAVAAASGSGGPPSGAAGGVLAGTYPNPSFSADMATQVELDAETVLRAAGDVAVAAGALANYAFESDVLEAKDLAQDAQREATDLDDATNRRIDFELDQKADLLEIGILRSALDTEVVDRSAADTSLSSRIGVIEGTDFATQVELDAHKVSADHDGRYYTETEIDALLASRTDQLGSDIAYAQDLAQDAIAEATNLDDATNRRIDFELDEKADRLDSDLVRAGLDSHLADTTAAHAASAIPIVDAANYYTSTNVETALQEVYLAQSTNTIASKYRGAWSASTQYAVGDIVIYSGNSIIATSTPTLGAIPVGNSLAGVWNYSTWDGLVWGSANGWTFLVAAGTAGAPGADGSLVVSSGDVFLAMDLAQDAQAEATNLDSDMDRKVEFELDQKADILHRHDEDYIQQSLLSVQGQTIIRGATGPAAGARATRALVAQAASRIPNGTSTTNQVLTETGTMEAFGGCPDAILFRYNASEWTVGGVVPSFVLSSAFTCNATAPGVVMNAGIAVVTSVTGGAGAFSLGAAGFIQVNAHTVTAGTCSHLEATISPTLVDGQLYVFYAGTATGSVAASSYLNLMMRIYAVYP